MAEEQEQKKEMSDLKFSDFESAGLKYDHSQDNVCDALGIGEEEYKDMATTMRAASEGSTTMSQAIQNTLECDAPTRWKIIALLKIGEAHAKGRTARALKAIPDGVPGELVKAMMTLEVMTGGI